MRGEVNTPIVLTIAREGADKPIEITIIRDVITVRSVRYRVEDDDIGFIDINAFNEQTFDGLEKAIKSIREEVGDEKLKGYIIDLRLNPGGLLDQAVSVSDTFLDRGLIVSTRGRNPDETRLLRKLLQGALQDHKRATILGTRSFGKGSVQTIIPLGANGALRLTTALYYTPADRSIQGKGIKPDIRVEQPLPEELQGRVEARGESNLRGHIVGNEEDEEGSGSIAYVPPDPKDDLQLIYAKDLIRGNKQHAAFPPDPEKAENEFNKPLKGYASKQEAKKVSSALVVAGLALLVGLPVFHFYGGFGYLASMVSKPQEVAEVNVVTSSPTPAVEEPKVLEVVPKREYNVDPNAEGLQELKPLERLKPLTPVILPPVESKTVRRQEQALAHLPDPEISERGATGVIPKAVQQWASGNGFVFPSSRHRG
ncbi:Carboxy-terminal-processing protease [Nymphon striatum]|nr:Carboxy-terminal-processing protease [Nymphon striatum]